MTFQSPLALQKRQLNSTIRDANTQILEQIDGKLPQTTSQNSLCKNKPDVLIALTHFHKGHQNDTEQYIRKCMDSNGTGERPRGCNGDKYM